MEEREKIRVLIAEDEESFRLVLEHVLANHPEYEYEACETGDQAISLLQERAFDVLILDYKMPGHSGLNILQWMHEQKMDTPVVLLTGAGSETIAVEAMKLGAYDYIRKDTFEKEHLPFIIRNARERYLFKQERELQKQVEEESTKNSMTLELLFNCMRSYGELMNTSLAVVSMEMELHEKELTQGVKAEAAAKSAQTYAEMRRQYEVIAMCTKSLLDLSKVMFDRLTTKVDTAAREKQLRNSLQDISEFSKRRADQPASKPR